MNKDNWLIIVLLSILITSSMLLGFFLVFRLNNLELECRMAIWNREKTIMDAIVDYNQTLLPIPKKSKKRGK